MPLLTATSTTQEPGDDMLNSRQHAGRFRAGNACPEAAQCDGRRLRSQEGGADVM